MGKIKITGKRLLILVFTLCVVLTMHPIGLKTIKPYTIGVLQDMMPWEIAAANNYVFVASDEGLVQYDGGFPLLFPIHNERPLRSVTIDNESQRIYVGGISEFGYFESSPFQALDYVCLSDSVGDNRHIGNIWGIYPDKDNLIVQADNAILKYDLRNHSHELISSPDKLDVSSMIDGVLWLGSDQGLKLLLSSNIVDAPQGYKLKGKRIRQILPYQDGLLIVTTDGLWKYSNQTLHSLPQYDEVFDRLKVAFSADLQGDLLALGSVSHGLAILNMKNGDFQIYDEKSGLPVNTVISIKFDEDGNLYAGLQFGLAKIELNSPVENISNTEYPIGSGYVLLRRGNALYMGTNRGLFRLDINEKTGQLEEEAWRVADLRGQVWGLSNIDGNLLCSMDQGLFLISESDDAHRIGDISGVWDVRRMNSMGDKAYVGTYNGFYILNKNSNGKWNKITPITGYNTSVFNFALEKADIVWNDCSEDGVERLKIDTAQFIVKQIQNFKEAADGTPLTSEVYICRVDNNIYFATKNGIYVFDPKKEEIVKEKDISKLLGDVKNVKRLKKANGALIALTDKELIQADPAGILDIKRIPLSPQISRPIHEGDLFFPLGNNYLGFPTKKGYLLFDFSQRSDSLWQSPLPERLVKSVMVSNMGDSVIFKSNFKGVKYEPELTYKENSVKIEYGNLSDLENGVLFSTRLNKEPWSVPLPTIMKELSDLQPGKYTFEVKAITPGGKESEDSITFRIKPPWWRTNWMFIIYATLFILLTLMGIRFEQIRVAKKHQRLLKEKNRELEVQQQHYLQETEEKDRQIEQLEREKLDKELKHKAQEVANVMMSLSHKNETLQTVKRELQNISSMVPQNQSDVRKAISQLQDKVVVDIKSDDILKRVEEEFDLVHDNFMKKLRANYPDLNNNEILLCAYLKMNLTTKEIAPLLNISARGVETMRYRLRKKLGMEREDSLTSFILNFK